MSQVILGVDVGTQSVKVVCYDAAAGQVLASASSGLELISEADGTREQLAEWWLEGLAHCLAQVDDSIKQQVKAVGVSGQQHGFVPLAADGSVLAPVKLWCDTSTVDECNEIMAAFGGEQACIAEVGNAIAAGYTAPKIRWLRNHKPDIYANLHTILLPHDYINFYLTGELAMEYGDASGTGLLDIRQRQWHSGMLAVLDSERDLSACLPPLIAADAEVGKLQQNIAVELGLPGGIPVSAGGGDNMMAAIGTGNVAPGRLTVSLGTSGTMFAFSDKPVVDKSGAIAAFCASTDGWLPLLCTMNCTVSTELTRSLLGMSVDELDSRVARVEPGAGGVVTLPFFNGERTPNLPNSKACILGLDDSNYTADNLLRSAMESAVYGLRAGLETFVSEGCEITGIRLTGGGSRSSSWPQMVADVFNLPVTVQQIDEGAALGAALQALWMLRRQGDKNASLAELVDHHLVLDEGRACTPDLATVPAYQDLFQNYLKHVAAVTPLYS